MSTPTTPLTFPHPTLTRIHGRPTYASLRTLRRELIANAMAVRSTRGGSAHGHVGLLVSAEEYKAYSLTPFIIDPHPGHSPTYPAGATDDVIRKTDKVFKELVQEHERADTVTNTLRQQILAAMDRAHLDVLEDEDFGFAKVHLSQFLDHLYTNYGEINYDDLNANKASILTAWNCDEPILKLWAKLKTIQAFATAGGDPISDETLMGNTLLLFESTGLHRDAVTMWRHQPATAKTWANFVPFFTAEEKERVKLLTKAQAGLGYHGANSAAPGPASSGPSTVYYSTCPPPSMTGTSVAGTSVSSLPNFSGMSTANNPTPARRAPTNNPNGNDTGGSCITHYCWSHGYTPNANHTSANCRNPKEGHCAKATFRNIMGGCQTFLSRNNNGARTRNPPTPST